MSTFIFGGDELPCASGRIVEYPWAKDHLLPPPAKTLDVGCCGSLAKPMVEWGYDAYGIEINEQWLPKIKGFKGSIQDIRSTNFPDNFFDQVIFLSTLEHVGLDWYYNKWIDVDKGDFMAIEETYRILRPGGSVLITVPYDSDHKFFTGVRVYNDERIDALSKDFQITVSDYFVDLDGWLIEPVSKDKAIEVGCPGNVLTLICFEMIKS